MSGYKSNTLENSLLLYIYNAVSINSSFNALDTATQLYVSLHNADPTAGGNQSSNETAYTNYTRIAVARTSGGWTVSGGSVSNAAAITFPACGVTGDTITHAAIGTASSGAGNLVYAGPLTGGSLIVLTDTVPQFSAAAMQISEQ